MKSKVFAALWVAVVITGCGGSGQRSQPSGRRAVKSAIAHLIAQSHVEDSGLSRVGLTTRSSARRSPWRKVKGRSQGRGEAYNNDSYYDSAEELWRIDTTMEWGINSTFWLEEAATTPAGTEITTWATSESYPWTTTTVYNITAGSSAGSHGTSSQTQDSEESNHSSFDFYRVSNGVSAGRLFGSDTWSADSTATWSVTAIDADGSTWHFEGTANQDGTATETEETEDGTSTTANHEADESGNGTVDAPNPANSATFEWTPDGTMTIHYADGTSETIHPQ